MLRALVHVGSVPILEAIPKASKATNSTADSHCLDFPSNKTMVVKGSNTSIELQLGAYYGDPGGLRMARFAPTDRVCPCLGSDAPRSWPGAIRTTGVTARRWPTLRRDPGDGRTRRTQDPGGSRFAAEGEA